MPKNDAGGFRRQPPFAHPTPEKKSSFGVFLLLGQRKSHEFDLISENLQAKSVMQRFTDLDKLNLLFLLPNRFINHLKHLGR